MKPMTKERLEHFKSIANGVFNQNYEIFTANEMNECLSEIQRLRGALELTLADVTTIRESIIPEEDLRGMEFAHFARKKIENALSPSDETEVTK